MVCTMLTAVFTAVLAVHLGLGDAIADVVVKVATCERCASFWLSLAALWYVGTNPITAVALAMAGAYLSHWVGLVFKSTQKLYTKLWQKINQ